MRKKSLLIALSCIILAVFAIGGCGLFGGDQSSPEKVTEAFMEALKNQDSVKLAELTGEDSGEMIFDVEEKIDSYVIEEVDSIEDNKGAAKVIFRFNEEDEEVFEVRYTLALTKTDDGKWFVTGLDFEFDWSLLDIQRTIDEEDIDEVDFDPDFDITNMEGLEDFDWEDLDESDLDEPLPEEEEEQE